MATTIKIGKFDFLCKSAWDNIAFHHTADAIYKWKHVGYAYCQYYNRTWERWTYQTAVLDALYNAKEKYSPRKWSEYEEWINSPLKKDIDEARQLARDNLY